MKTLTHPGGDINWGSLYRDRLKTMIETNIHPLKVIRGGMQKKIIKKFITFF